MTWPVPVTAHQSPEALAHVPKHVVPGGGVGGGVGAGVGAGAGAGVAVVGVNKISSMAISPDQDPAVVQLNLS